jgi:hypothetical protein
MRKSDTKTIIGAMRILSREIYCEDGVATAAIAEAADRLEEISLENGVILRNQLKLHEENEKLKKDLFDSDMSRSILLRDVAFWRDYADKLVAHKDMVCLPKDLQNLRAANSQFATENHILKEQLRMMEASKNKTTWT